MTWKFLAVRTADDPPNGLYPDVGGDHVIELLPDDGHLETIVATGIQVYETSGGKQVSLGSLRDIKAEVFITDCRIAIGCTKFDKGGGYWGFGGAGVAVALVANGVSKARAAHRRRGKVLVGHVRYQWLSSVGFKPKRGFGSSEEIRLVVKAKDGGSVRTMLIDLVLPKNVDSQAVVTRLAARAGQFFLNRTPVADETERARLAELVQGVRLEAPEPKKFALVSFPRFWFVMSTTSDPGSLQIAVPKQAPEAIS